jgi:hypothetical protein
MINKLNTIICTIILAGLAGSLSAQAPIPDTTQLFPEIKNWVRGEIKHYTSDNLYQPIDGAADLFLRYNFEEMQSASYTADSNYISVEIYRHATPDDAFGIYSQERPRKEIYFNIGIQGYKEYDYINFLSGRCYVKLRCAQANQASLQTMETIAKKIAEKVSDQSVFPKIFSALPTEGRIKYSEKYIALDILGYSFLHSSFEAEYQRGSKNFTLFILRGTDENDVIEMMRAYFKHLKEPISDFPDGMYEVSDKYNGRIGLYKVGRYILCCKGRFSTDDDITMLNEMKLNFDKFNP